MQDDVRLPGFCHIYLLYISDMLLLVGDNREEAPVYIHKTVVVLLFCVVITISPFS